jgi:predicted RNA-binding protein Jag
MLIFQWKISNNEIEVEGRTVEEAVKKASSILKVPESSFISRLLLKSRRGCLV